MIWSQTINIQGQIFEARKIVYLVEKGICIPNWGTEARQIQIENLILKKDINIIISKAQWDMM